MRARRSVGAAKRQGDAAGERLARTHVHDAKVALGERGPKWWEPQTDAELRPRVAATSRALLRHRGIDKTICPSDVARVVGGEGWRKRMEAVRATLLALAEAGELQVRQKGKIMPPQHLRGPIRLALPPTEHAPAHPVTPAKRARRPAQT